MRVLSWWSAAPPRPARHKAQRMNIKAAEQAREIAITDPENRLRIGTPNAS